jgi:hypothetical protein
VAERHAALREAFGHLPPCCQQLIALLTENPPLSSAQISARLGIPVGSIGRNRGRCLDKLRHHPAIAALINANAKTATSDKSLPTKYGRPPPLYRVFLASPPNAEQWHKQSPSVRAE